MWVKENKWLLAALITGGMIRAVFLFFFYPDLNTDPDAYKQIAENVCNQGVFGQVFASQMQPTAYRPPLYPCLLSLLVTPDPLGVGVVSIGYVAAFHFALGLLTLWFAFQLACRFGFEGPRCFGVA
ncbi:MAG: hypothetical protein VX438_12600, partial [Planctomycetota bacterium]|nr:hypothetical protein [Planctomycetota bacterium]